MSSSVQLERWAAKHRIPGFLGVFAADTLPRSVPQQPWSLIVNYEGHTEPGDHWVACIGSHGRALWCSSYGFPPDEPADVLLGDKRHSKRPGRLFRGTRQVATIPKTTGKKMETKMETNTETKAGADFGMKLAQCHPFQNRASVIRFALLKKTISPSLIVHIHNVPPPFICVDIALPSFCIPKSVEAFSTK